MPNRNNTVSEKGRGAQSSKPKLGHGNSLKAQENPSNQGRENGCKAGFGAQGGDLNENNMDKCEDSNGKKIIKSAKMDKNGQNKEQLINGARSKTEEPKQETNKLKRG